MQAGDAGGTGVGDESGDGDAETSNWGPLMRKAVGRFAMTDVRGDPSGAQVDRRIAHPHAAMHGLRVSDWLQERREESVHWASLFTLLSDYNHNGNRQQAETYTAVCYFTYTHPIYNFICARVALVTRHTPRIARAEILTAVGENAGVK